MKHTDAVVQVFAEMGFPAKRAWLGGAVLYGGARTYDLLARELSKVYARFGLTAVSFNLLMLLRHGADPHSFSQQEIGKRLVVSPSDMTGLIDRLERKGYVKRLPGRDRRSKLLRITMQGAKIVDEVWPHHLRAATQLTNVLSEPEALALVRAFATLRRALER